MREEPESYTAHPMRWTSVVAAVGVTILTSGSAVLAANEPCPAEQSAELMAEGVPPAESVPSRLSIRGQKVLARPLQRSEAGLSLALSPTIAVELNYARNAFPPMFQNDHDDGILTRLRLGF